MGFIFLPLPARLEPIRLRA